MIKMMSMLERWELLARVAARLPPFTQQLQTALVCKVQLVYCASMATVECASRQPIMKAKTRRKYGAFWWTQIASVLLQPPALVGKHKSAALTPGAVCYFWPFPDLSPAKLWSHNPNTTSLLQCNHLALPCDDKVPCMVNYCFINCCYNMKCKPACCKTLADIDPEKYNHEQELDAIPQANVGYGAPLEIEAER